MNLFRQMSQRLQVPNVLIHISHRAKCGACRDHLAALDAEWEETAVTFGPGNSGMDGCSSERLQTRMRAARRDVRANAP